MFTALLECFFVIVKVVNLKKRTPSIVGNAGTIATSPCLVVSEHFQARAVELTVSISMPSLRSKIHLTLSKLSIGLDPGRIKKS